MRVRMAVCLLVLLAGAAAACANLLGLNPSQTVYALGIAGTQASGIKQVFGTMCKPFHAGKAAMNCSPETFFHSPRARMAGKTGAEGCPIIPK